MMNGIDTPIDDYGNTALHLATIQNDYELVSMLLLKGANPNVKNKGNIKPRMIAKCMNFVDIYKVLSIHEHSNCMNKVAMFSSSKMEGTEAKANENGDQNKLKNKKVKGTKLLLSLNYDDHCGSDNDSTFKYQNSNTTASNHTNNTTNITNSGTTTAKTESTDNCEIDNSISNKMYCNYPNNFERQKNLQYHKKYFPKYYLPVYNMAFLGLYKENLFSLMDKNVIEEADENGSTPLMKACYRGNFEFVKKLLEKDANINATDNLGYTALVWAALNGHTKICDLLIKKGADINKIYGNGKMFSVVTPLVAAAYGGWKDTVELLIHYGVDINKKLGASHNTALTIATLKFKFEVVDLLLQNGAEFNENLTWINDGVYLTKILEKNHNHWLVNNNFIESLLFDNGKYSNIILSKLKQNKFVDNSKKINDYTKEDKTNIKNMQSLYQYYILKKNNPEIKHVLSSSIIKKNNSIILSNESIDNKKIQEIKNKYAYIEVC